MGPERSARVREVLEAALDRPPHERGAYLDHACAFDPDLRREVDALLACEDSAKGLPVRREHGLPRGSLVGESLAHYQILEEAGRGGMGEVYRARDTKLGRDVAIKILPEALARDQARVTRFEREARLLASLNHPHIATLHGFGDSDGLKYLVMEWVEGETLSERIAKSALPLEEAMPLFIEIAQGLESAHGHGIIHRDLKPANIKITPAGDVKILDFGLAKAYTERVPPANPSELPTAAKETSTGVILGTAPYMSPEQARGKALDKRTDIWSFGCVMYESLTGKVTFSGETVPDTLAAISSDEPAWERLPSNTPAGIERVLRRCLRKDPEERMRDIGDARIEIQEAGEPHRASPEHRSLAWTAMAIISAISIAIAIWSLVRNAAPDSQGFVRAELALEPGSHFSPDGWAPALAMSPDGRRIAYVAGSGDSTRLYLRALNENEARPVDHGEGARMPFFSPDSEWLGFLAENQLMKVSVTGGAAVSVTETERRARGASWGDDGRIVFNPSSNAGMWSISADGGEARTLTTPDRARLEKGHRFPEVLPGAAAVLFTILTADVESHEDASIAVLSLETGEYRVVLEGGTNARYHPSGRLVYAREDGLHAVPFDLSALRVTGRPVRVVQDVRMSPLGGQAEYSLSSGGSLLHASGRAGSTERSVLWVDRDGRSSEPFLKTSRRVDEPRLSPDGRSLTLVDDAPNSSIWLYELGRASFTRVVSRWDNLNPAWTPDGRHLLFASNRAGASNLFRQAVDGSGEAERITSSDYDQFLTSRSGDGKMLAFEGLRLDTGLDVWIVSLDGDEPPRPFLQTRANEWMAEFSPGGRFIAYVSNESGRHEVYVRAFPGPGGKWPVSTEGGVHPVWNPNGRELFYLNGDKMMLVDIDISGELSLGKPRVLFETRFRGHEAIYQPYDIAPDGQHFVMVDAIEPDPPLTSLHLLLNWSDELEHLVPTN